MADFTLTNLMGLDDLAAGRAEGIHVRMARSALATSDLGVSLFRYDAGVRAPYGHRHSVQEEVYVVIEGSGRIRLDDEVVDVRQWDAVRIAPTVVRTVEGGPDGITFIAIGGPRPPEGDGEMLADDVWVDE